MIIKFAPMLVVIVALTTAVAESKTSRETAQSEQSQVEQGASGAKGGKRGSGRRLAACRSDIATFCQSVAKGGGRLRCLKENAAKLSPACSEAVSAMPKRDGKGKRT